MDSRYRIAAEKFAQKYMKRKDVLGILIVGSITYRAPDKNSDVDMQIILDKAKTRTRGNTTIDGIEIEYFINPVNQIRAYLKNEESKHTADMLSNSIVLYKKSNVVDELVAEAKKVLARKRPKMRKVKRELAIYSLDDYRKDLDDVFARNDSVGVNIIAHAALEECADILLAHHQVIGEKRKRLIVHLQKIDPVFAKLYAAAAGAEDAKKRYAFTMKAISHVEKLIGGPRKEEWRLEGPLKL